MDEYKARERVKRIAADPKNKMTVWSMATGLAYQGIKKKQLINGKVVDILIIQRTIQFSTPGFPDFVGIKTKQITEQMVGQKVGVFVGIECKSTKGRLSNKQEKFKRAIEMRGGEYLLIRPE